MGQKNDLAQDLEARARAALTLAEGQALHAAADRVRAARAPYRFTGWALYRN
jgi:hypothetical protein